MKFALIALVVCLFAANVAPGNASPWDDFLCLLLGWDCNDSTTLSPESTTAPAEVNPSDPNDGGGTADSKSKMEHENSFLVKSKPNSKDSHIKSKESHTKGKESHSKNKNSHSKNKNSHSKNKNSHSKNKNSHSKNKNAHSKSKDSHKN